MSMSRVDEMFEIKKTICAVAVLCFDVYTVQLNRTWSFICTVHSKCNKKKFIRYYYEVFYKQHKKEQQKLSVPPAASGKTKENSHKIYEKAQALWFTVARQDNGCV